MADTNNIAAGLRVGLPHWAGENLTGEESAPVTYSTADAAEQMGAPSERWVIDQIRSGRFPARKIGRAWRMTDCDIRDALEACCNTLRASEHSASARTSLIPTSRRRLERARLQGQQR